MTWRRIIDELLEAPIAPSFTRVGYDVRRCINGWDDDAYPDLTGRVILLTGGTSGLGRASALALADLGAHVIITGRDGTRTESAAAEIAADASAGTIDAIAG